MDSDTGYERSYWRKRNKGRRKYPCPTCKKENALAAHEVAKHYQCNECADKAEGGVPGY